MRTTQMSQPQCHSWHDASLRLEVYIQTRARRDAMIGLHSERIKIAIATTPIDGKANKQLINFLAKHFAVSRSQVQIVLGVHSHYKSVMIVNPKQNICDYPR